MGIVETILLVAAAVILTFGFVEAAIILGQYFKGHQL